MSLCTTLEPFCEMAMLASSISASAFQRVWSSRSSVLFLSFLLKMWSTTWVVSPRCQAHHPWWFQDMFFRKKTWKNIALITSDSRFLHFWSCSNLRKAFREVWRAKGLTSKGRRSTQSARLVQRRQTGKWEVSCRFQNNSKVWKAQNWDSGIPSTVYSGSKSEKVGSKRNQSH